MEWWQTLADNGLNSRFYGVNLIEWCIFVGFSSFVGGLSIYLRKRLYRRLNGLAERTHTQLDDLLVTCIAKTHGVFLFLSAAYLAAAILELSGPLIQLLTRAWIIAVFVQIALWGNELIAFWLQGYLSKRIIQSPGLQGTVALTTYGAINYTCKFLLWTVLLLLLLDNLGVDITALVTGLGIGGIAIALAVQNILGDMFASLSIVLDKPFEVGDFISVGDKSGTVESIGLKTSRLRSLSGEQLVFPNKQLIESQIQNFKRMQERRIQFGFSVLYDTKPELLEQISKCVQDIIRSQPRTRFDRAHFKGFGTSSLDFEVVYIMESADYNLYMDTQELINLAIVRRLATLGVEFAAPTRTWALQGLERVAELMRGQERRVDADQPQSH